MIESEKDKLRRAIQENYNLLENHFVAEKEIQSLEQRETEAELKAIEKRDIIKMRKMWSIYILSSILFIVIFDALLITFLGLKIINFEQKYTAPIIIGESTAKMFLLAYVVAKFLFNEKSLPNK